MLREHEHADFAKRGTDPFGRDEPLVGEGWPHADVDERHVGQVAGHLLVQLGRLARCRNNVDSVIAEQGSEPISDERSIVGDHHWQRSLAPLTPAHLVNDHSAGEAGELHVTLLSEAQIPLVAAQLPDER